MLRKKKTAKRLTYLSPHAFRPSPIRRQSSADVQMRLQYICEYFFGGQIATFCWLLKLEPRNVEYWLTTKNVQRIPLFLLIRVAQCTNVRAAWLLCGTGPMLRSHFTEEEEDVLGTKLPEKLRTALPLFSRPAALPNFEPRPTVFYPTDCHTTAVTDDAAQLIFDACGAKKPLFVFAGASGTQYCRKLLVRLIRQGGVSGLCLTSKALEFEATLKPHTDFNTIARLGACSGLGLGEAFQRWGGATAKSPITLTRHANVPFMAHVIFGEMSATFAAPVNGADVGAALGACAYIDLLAIAEQVRRVMLAGGVFLVVGDACRAADVFLTAALHMSPEETTRYAILVLGARLPDELCESFHYAGGDVRFLEGDLMRVAEEFRLSCVKVFDGQFHDDIEEDSTDD